MAKEYNIGDRLYLPVWITNKESNLVMYKDNNELVTDAKFSYAYWHGKTGEGKVRYGEEGLLLTAEEIYASRRMVDEVEHLTDMLDYGRKKYDEIEELKASNEELKARNAELEALLKEVMATRDEAIKQNNELIAENKKLKDGADKLKDTLVDRTKDVQHLTEENANLKAWYEEANKTASEAAEANDDLKAKITDLRIRVGEQLAQIQDLNAEVHYIKEERDLKAKLAQEWHDNAHSTAKGLDELKGRYDELDSVNKEQAEKIRRQDKALTDLKKRNDDLQAENTNLTFLLEDAPEKETTKTLHVVLNDGTEIEFRRYTACDYRTDIKMFVVKDGERFIAGFLRGDKPMNLAYWWTE